jgi:hypothetical protein
MARWLAACLPQLLSQLPYVIIETYLGNIKNGYANKYLKATC